MRDMARWVQDVKLSDLKAVGCTIVAGWWPTTFHRVLTLEQKVASATEGIAALTRQIFETFPEKCGPARDYYISLVHRVNRFGIPKSEEDAEFAVEYPDIATAISGHIQLVAALAEGESSAFRLVSSWKAQV